MKNVTKFMLLVSMIIGATSCSSVASGDTKLDFKSEPCDIKLRNHYDSLMFDLLLASDSLEIVSGQKRVVINDGNFKDWILTRGGEIQVHDTDLYIVVYARIKGNLAKYRKYLEK